MQTRKLNVRTRIGHDRADAIETGTIAMTTSRRTACMIAVLMTAASSACGIDLAESSPTTDSTMVTTATTVEGSTTTSTSTSTSTSTTTTTTEPPTTTTTTPEPLSSEDLKALLPAVADLGGGFAEVGQSAGLLQSREVLDACPDIGLMRISLVGVRDETISFEAPNFGGVDVRVGNTIATDAELLDTYVAALDGCPLDFEINSDDVTARVTGTVNASRDNTFGDIGVRVTAPVKLSGPELRSDVNFTIESFYWANGLVGASAAVQAGVDGNLNEVPGRTELLLEVAGVIDGRIDDL